MNEQNLDKLLERLNNLKNEYDTLAFLLDKHTDAVVDKTHNGYRYCASSVNTMVTHVYIFSACEVYYASPYLLINNVPVYSFPDRFCIGLPYESGEGILPNDNWKQNMIKYNLPTNIIKQCEEYLNFNSPVLYED